MQDAITGLPEHYKYEYCGWWEEIKGGNVCGECDLSVTDYILECRQCLSQSLFNGVRFADSHASLITRTIYTPFKMQEQLVLLLYLGTVLRVPSL